MTEIYAWHIKNMTMQSENGERGKVENIYLDWPDAFAFVVIFFFSDIFSSFYFQFLRQPINDNLSNVCRE